MKYTRKDVIHTSDVDRGLIKEEDLIGKEAYFSNSIDYVVRYANENFEDFLGKIDTINKYLFQSGDIGGSYIILKKEPKYKYVPYEFSEETWNEIKGREVYYYSPNGIKRFVICQLEQLKDRVLINNYESVPLCQSAKFMDTGEPVGKKVLVED